MKKILTLTALVAVLLGLSACRKLVTERLPDMAPRPTLNALLQVGLPVEAQVSLSQGFDNEPLPIVSNAVIRLFVDSVFVENLTPSARGIYRGQTRCEEGKHYRFEGLIDTFPLVSASTLAPPALEVLKTELLRHYGVSQDGMRCHALKLTFRVDPAQAHYIQIYFQTISENVYRFENLRDPLILREGLSLGLFSTEGCTDTSYSMILPFISASSFSSGGGMFEYQYEDFYVKIRSLSPEAFQFLKSSYLYDATTFPSFSSGSLAPLNTFSNVENGLGIVGSYCFTTTKKIKVQ